MRVKAYTFLLLSMIAVGLAGLEACGGGGASSTNVIVTALTLSPTSITVSINTTANVTATPTLSNNTVVTTTVVTWIVNGTAGGNSTIGTIVPSPTDQLV